MKLLAALLATVSLVAIAAAAPSTGQEVRGVVVEATGGFLMGPNAGAQQRVEDNLSIDSYNIEDLTGGFGAIALGADFGGWDLRGRLSYTSLNPGAADYFDDDVFDKIGQIDTDLDYQTLDLEVGYAPALDDDFDLRFFAGARALHYTNSLVETEDKVGPPPPTTEEFDNEFLGFGPRAGLEFATTFADTPFGISGAVAGGVIFGNETRTHVDGSSTTVEVDKTVVNLEAAIGVDYHFNDAVTATVGYRGEALSGVNDFESADGAAGQLVHGPFVKLKAAL